MKVRLLESLSKDGTVYLPGDIADLDDKLAKELVDTRVAESLDSLVETKPDPIPAGDAPILAKKAPKKKKKAAEE